ncbi:Tim17-domain-containing protein [Cantharellus anzutake]|uniref:Tim17-domain-containing protein n=1 Tax=Cantharellus anzutake TaxID=1750568 RepID=UPI001904C43E|nr:Tim17-domain-containing protein [Cantharellus anzutake]XP_038918518.1 Tim17-domain-containing protein [Cantharellus anzutake]KAF8329703.1 Tim17-domain-containing protein [Cantharellus anzutake]KAF8335295.1 Tim17-domain-containing protein [Cantharellus anzutake]
MPPSETSASESTSLENNTASYLRNASFTRSAPPPFLNTDGPLTASDLLTSDNFDPTKLHPMANLGDNLDFLVLEDDKRNQLPGAETALPSRGWTDDLCYGTGTTYLSALGGLWGLREGGTRQLAVSNSRLRLNSILNSITRRGSFMGNSAGVLALIYNAINSSIDHYRGKHDTYGGMAAGALTGALFKSTAGVRPMLAAATLMTGAAGIWSLVKRSLL